MNLEELKDLIIDVETIQICIDRKIHDLMERSERNKLKLEDLKSELSRINIEGD